MHEKHFSPVWYILIIVSLEIVTVRCIDVLVGKVKIIFLSRSYLIVQFMVL